MPEKIARAYSRGCVTQLIAAAVGIPVMALVAWGAWRVASTVVLPTEASRPLVVGAFEIVGLAIVVLVLVAVAIALLARRAARMDEAFESVGLTGHIYLQNGRQYHGRWGGRRVDAYFYRGPTVDLFVESPVHTRIGIGGRSVIAKAAASAMGKAELLCDLPGFSDIVVYPTEPDWASRLLADGTAQRLIPRLTHDADRPERRLLIIGPDAVHLNMQFLREAEITPEAVHRWIDDLSELARACEDLDPPNTELHESAWERQARVERGKIARRLTCLVLVVVLVVLVPALVVLPLVLVYAMQ